MTGETGEGKRLSIEQIVEGAITDAANGPWEAAVQSAAQAIRTILATPTQEGVGREALRERLAFLYNQFGHDGDFTWPEDKVRSIPSHVDQPHSGDCTKNSWPCLRCHAEEAYAFANGAVDIILSLLPAPKPWEGERLQALLDGLGYDRVFNAIADATRVAEGGGIGISVEAFIASVSGQPNRIEERAKPQEPAPSGLVAPPGHGVHTFTDDKGTWADVRPAQLAQQPAPGAPEGWREALEFYANEAWETDGDQGYDHDDNVIEVVTTEPSDALLDDKGERARRALTSSSAKLGGEGQRLSEHIAQFGGATALEQNLAAENKALAQSNRRLREGLENVRDYIAAAKAHIDKITLVKLPIATQAQSAGHYLAAATKALAALKDNGHG